MFVRNLWPALAWAVFVLVLCGLPGDKIPKLTFWQWLKPDKMTHLVIFGVQAWLLLTAFQSPHAPRSIHTHPVRWAILLTILFGVLTEVLQVYVFVNRFGDWKDAMANALGALLGVSIYRRRKPKQVQ